MSQNDTNKNGLGGAVLNKIRNEYYKDVLQDDKGKTFNSGNTELLKILIKAHKKIEKQKKLSIEEINALLAEEESYWSTYTKSHEASIKRMYIQNNIRDEKVYNKLIDIEKERLQKSVENKKIIPLKLK